MDSCEYLSKHFGTQTIHKASESDAKDYKGQSSRSEDVMQKSLLSAEDNFCHEKRWGMRYCGKRYRTLISDKMSDGKDRFCKTAVQKKESV